MNKAVAGVLVALVVMAAVGGGYWFGAKQSGPDAMRGVPGTPVQGKAAPAGMPGAVTIEAVKVATQSLPQTITAVGSLRSDESVTLRPEVAGRISSIAFREGERVAKGAMLVRLDPAVPQAEV
ncbi:MAG TPA: biotin/lipoyl-binding protein, partial [Casimicrobiaceae bacterium]